LINSLALPERTGTREQRHRNLGHFPRPIPSRRGKGVITPGFLSRSFPSRFMAMMFLVTTAYAQDLPSSNPVPGGIAVVSLGNSPSAPYATFRNQRVIVVPCNGAWCAVVGVGLEIKPGEQALSVKRDGLETSVPIAIGPKQYDVQRLTIKEKGYVDLSPADLKRYERDTQETTRAFTFWSDSEPALR